MFAIRQTEVNTIGHILLFNSFFNLLMSQSNFPVLFDARMIQHSGIGTHIRGLLEAFALLADRPDLTLIGDPELLGKYPFTRDLDCLPFTAPIYGLREQLSMPKGGAEQIFHSPHYNIPLFRKAPLVVTVHDLIHLLFPEMLGSSLKKAYAKYFFAKIRKSADHILTVSEATKRDLMEHLGIQEQRITVAHNALGVDFQPVDDAAEINAFKQFTNFPSEYLLAVGIDKPHKNLDGLVSVLADLWVEQKLDVPLVVAGIANPAESNLLKIAASRGVDRKLILAPRIKNEWMPLLYQCATALVFPSIYEGFGLPVLEAQAAGCPVACSNRSSLPEVAGEAALFFDPENRDAMREAILKIVEDHTLRTQLLSLAEENVKKFSWQEIAEKTLNVYKSILA